MLAKLCECAGLIVGVDPLTSFVIAISQHEEHVLENRYVELTEKYARCLLVSLGHIIHQLQAHCETRVLHLAIIVLRCPHARVDHEFELSGIELQECLEAVQVYGLEKLEELHAVFGIFVKILVYHL